jgi:hypothetical protein
VGWSEDQDTRRGRQELRLTSGTTLPETLDDSLAEGEGDTLLCRVSPNMPGTQGMQAEAIRRARNKLHRTCTVSLTW